MRTGEIVYFADPIADAWKVWRDGFWLSAFGKTREEALERFLAREEELVGTWRQPDIRQIPPADLRAVAARAQSEGIDWPRGVRT